MRGIWRFFREFCRRDDGPTTTEYAAMLALVIIVCISAAKTLGTNVRNTFSHVANSIQGLHPISPP
jgi:Flp pilus assembly pilin Flp